MNITLTQLQYIVAVDTYGNFSRAAEKCFITQPTLSMQIQKLEDVLGVEIFDRSKKPIIPTDIGIELIDQARVILRESNKIDEILSLKSGVIAGEFKVGVIPTIAPFLLPLFLRQFNEKYPEVDLIIHELQTDQIIDHLKKDLIDVGILATPLKVDGITEEPLYYEPFNVYLPKDHELYGKKNIKMAQLPVDELLLLDEGHCLREQALQVCSIKGKGPVVANVHFKSGNLDTLKKLTDQGFGYTLLPELMTREFAKSDADNVRKISAPVPKREISLVYGRSYLKKQITEAFKEVILENISKELKKKTGEVIPLYR